MKFVGNRREFKKKSGIYKITCLSNNRIYVGSSKNITSRYEQHWYGLRGNKHKSCHLQNAWNKYGEDSFIFEIIELCPEETRIEREQYHMDNLRSYDKEVGFNICLRADKGHKQASLETREKIRQKALGRKKSEDTKSKIKESWEQNRDQWVADLIDLGGVEFDLKSPTGEIFHGKGIRAFARKHGLDHSSIRNVLDGKTLTTKGWTLPNAKETTVIDPMGNQFIIPYRQAKNFAKTHGLNSGWLCTLIRGEISNYRGWTTIPRT